MKTQVNNEIVIGVSSCLLGQKVRFDANHKEHRFITNELSKKFSFLPICPEMAIGLGVPRTPIHLAGDESNPRAVNVRDNNIDVTEQLVEFGKKQARQLNHISGYIFKKGSPSCGLFNVKIYKTPDHVVHTGTGLYAQQIIDANPLLPVEEEGRLNDAQLRANFLQRVEVYHRWQQLSVGELTSKKLVDFHTRHKFMVLAHCEMTYRELGRIIAQAGKSDLRPIAEKYIELLMEGLKKPTTRGKQMNVLEHLVGYFKKHLDSQDKSEMRKLLESYRAGELPRVVLITMLKHYLRKFPSQYVGQQYYLKHCYSEI